MTYESARASRRLESIKSRDQPTLATNKFHTVVGKNSFDTPRYGGHVAKVFLRYRKYWTESGLFSPNKASRAATSSAGGRLPAGRKTIAALPGTILGRKKSRLNITTNTMTYISILRWI